MSNNFKSPEAWRRNFRPHVNEKRVDWKIFELDLVAGATIILKMEYEGSPLVGTDQGVITLECQPDIDVTKIQVFPPPGQRIDMVEGSKSLSWEISTDKAISGRFIIYFTLPNYSDMSSSPPIPGEILDEPWVGGFTYLVNDEKVELTELNLNVVERECCKLTVNYEGSALPGR